MTIDASTIGITAEPTADPNVCRFTVDRVLHETGAVHCRNRDDAQGSPLLAALFAVGDVGEVAVAGHLITVRKAGERPWGQVAREVGAAIRQGIIEADGAPLVAAHWGERSSDDDALRERVTAILERDINPQIASHGGWTRVADVRNGTVFLELGGGCQGCASSQATLRGSIERTLRQQIQEITAIVDVTDHGAGTNPYYR